MELSGQFAVGFDDLVVGGGRVYVEEGVEGGVRALGGADFVVEAEDLMV